MSDHDEEDASTVTRQQESSGKSKPKSMPANKAILAELRKQITELKKERTVLKKNMTALRKENILNKQELKGLKVQCNNLKTDIVHHTKLQDENTKLKAENAELVEQNILLKENVVKQALSQKLDPEPRMRKKINSIIEIAQSILKDD